MLPYFKPLAYDKKPSIDWIRYAAQLPRQPELHLSSHAAVPPPNAPNSHGQISDAALYGGSAAHRKY